MGTGFRQRAGVEDLLLGEGTEDQQRQSGSIPITKINSTNIPAGDGSGDSVGDVLVELADELEAVSEKADNIKQSDTNNLSVGLNSFTPLSISTSKNLIFGNTSGTEDSQLVDSIIIGHNSGALSYLNEDTILLGHNLDTPAVNTSNYISINDKIIYDGVNGLMSLKGDIETEASAKVYLGPKVNDTYITENTGKVELSVDGTKTLDSDATDTNIYTDVKIPEDKKIYTNSLDTYIESPSADPGDMDIVCGGNQVLKMRPDGSATAKFVPKAWGFVIFDGLNYEVKRGSNILSIIPAGTGIYQVFFINPMETDEYSVMLNATEITNLGMIAQSHAFPPAIELNTTTYCYVKTLEHSSPIPLAADFKTLDIIIFE